MQTDYVTEQEARVESLPGLCNVERFLQAQGLGNQSFVEGADL